MYNYGDSYFANLPNLEEIVIPNGVTKLDLNLFVGCTNLKKVTLPASINSWGSLREG
ncbi:MAG: leucine-rich repeat protein, partial [Bacilli bacterium]